MFKLVCGSLVVVCATACSVLPSRSPDRPRGLAVTVDPGGCRIEQVTNADSGTGNFQFHGPSADQRRLLVGWFRGEETGAYLLDMRTGSRLPLPRLNNGGVFSADGRFLLVATRLPQGNREIVEYEIATGATTVIAPSTSAEFLATYAPDGKSILFNSYRTGRSDIYRIVRGDTTPQRLTSFDGYDAHADWAPDQQTIVFHREVTKGDYDIFSLDLRTGRERLLVGGPGEQAYPALSPDGKLLAYASDSASGGGKVDLYVTDLARTRTVRLTHVPGYNTYPAWSKDGRTLYFNAERLGQRNVMRLHFKSPMVCLS